MEPGRLQITEEILERVVYGMENQKQRLLLDPAGGNLRQESENDGSFIPMPAWGPTDGYRLMDGFAGTLPNTVLRERLLEILHSGNGVFRHFKDALKERPEIERLWRQYKKKEMRKAALSWLSRWNDALTMENLGPEPEEVDDLALSDFGFRNAESGDFVVLEAWNRVAGSEGASDLRVYGDDLRLSEGLVTVAEGPEGELVGFSRIVVNPIESESCITRVYVLPEFRGLGIGRRLVSMAIDRAENDGAKSFSIRTGESETVMEDYLKSTGFVPVTTLWRKPL